jgi:ABC-type Na+ efflux pump permease subunit
MTWLIARRAAVEALQDRFTLLMSLVFMVALPLGVVVFVVRPQASSGDPGLGFSLTFLLLMVGLLPAFSAIGIAAGQFAGEHERGVLIPLLAAPASNLALFGGKVLGAVLPPLAYTLVAVLVYLGGLLVVLEPSQLAFLSVGLVLATLLMVAGLACFGAVVASLISSRVRTYNSAQQLAGLVMGPVLAALLSIVGRLLDRGVVALLVGVVVLVLLDGALAVVAAATWRREEVLSRR